MHTGCKAYCYMVVFLVFILFLYSSFRTSKMEIVIYCHEFFGCDLLSVTLRKRYVKFIDTNGHTRYFRSSYR